MNIEDSEITLELLFVYTVQRVAQPGSRPVGVLQRQMSMRIAVNGLRSGDLDMYGRPKWGPLWFAENEFLSRIGAGLSPDLRVIGWEARLARDPSIVLSEHQIVLPAAD